MFDKSFKITVPITLAIIIAGLIGVAVLGFNNGVDFQAGLNAIGPVRPGLDGRDYKGEGSMTSRSPRWTPPSSRASLRESKSYTFAFAQYPTLQVHVRRVQGGPPEFGRPHGGRLVDSELPPRRLPDRSQLGEIPGRPPLRGPGLGSAIPGAGRGLRAALESSATMFLSSAGDEGGPSIRHSPPRIRARTQEFSKTIIPRLTSELGKAFGAEMSWSTSPTSSGRDFQESSRAQAVWLTLGTFVLIMIYCSFRFQPAYAVGAVFGQCTTPSSWSPSSFSRGWNSTPRASRPSSR